MAISTEAAIARLIRGTAAHAVQTTPWKAAIEATAEAALQNAVTVNILHQTTATTLLDAPHIACQTALTTTLHDAHLTATGPHPGTTRQPDIANAPQTPTVMTPLRDTTRSRWQMKPQCPISLNQDSLLKTRQL